MLAKSRAAGWRTVEVYANRATSMACAGNAPAGAAPDINDLDGVLETASSPAGPTENTRTPLVLLARGAICALLSGLLDEFSRECLAIKVKQKLNSTDVIEALTHLIILRGLPAHVRSDNGPKFVVQAVRDWIAAVGAKTAYIEPGSPWDNGYVESFNARFRPSRPIASQSPAGQWTNC